MNDASNIRPLHLHTVESLCADLVSDRAVGVGAKNESFVLNGEHARSVLQWYTANRSKWAGNVFAADCDAIADSLAVPPKVSPAVSFTHSGKARTLTLVNLRAHRFAGLHKYRKATAAPEVFHLDFKSPITFLEGLNGAGKTSILNAIVWCLTGQLFRPQRAPESGVTEFQCELTPAAGAQAAEAFKAVAVVPLPDLDLERPSGPGVVDTWVELTFADEDGKLLPSIRRQLSRTAKGKLTESEPQLNSLGVDPVVVRSGTVMAALLPYIQFEGPSALGKAVAELTGLAPLVQLTKHATKASARLLGDSTKERRKEVQQLDEAYSRSRTDLLAQVAENSSLAFNHVLPEPDAQGVDEALSQTKAHFDELSATRLAQAKEVLGDGFNPQADKDRRDLQDSIDPAFGELGHLKSLPSATRLSDLGAVTPEQHEAARTAIAEVLKQATSLVNLAQDESRAARLRLYAAVGSWMQAHPEFKVDPGKCPVCDASLEEATDAITGEAVQDHIQKARHGDAAVVAQTLLQWAKAAGAELNAQLPTALQAELRRDLPEHPRDLVKAALASELWDSVPFKGVLAVLKEATVAACDKALGALEPLPASQLPDLDAALPGLAPLQQMLTRLDKALRFAQWRAQNASAMAAVALAVVGRTKDAEGRPPDSLASKLQKLRVIVESVGPIKQAQELCTRMTQDFDRRKKTLQRIEQYSLAAAALQECAALGTLAEEQVAQLQQTLEQKTLQWRNRIYLGAWPATNLDLKALDMGTDGRFEFQVDSSGVTAPAQHVSNASALRANLIGFYLAYWQYLQSERGGLRLMILDDPQELLDGENRNRLAESLALLAFEGAQLAVTTHDRVFGQLLVLAGRGAKVDVDHRSVHPPSKERPTLQTCPSVSQVQRLHEAILKDENDVVAARDYASECRVFIETRLGDFFDQPAYPASSASTLQLPTLVDHVNRLKGAVKPPAANELFRSPILRELAADPALQQQSPVLALLNKAHHQKFQVQPSEVKACRKDMERVRKLVEQAHEQLRLFLRRERLPSEFDAVPSLELGQLPVFNVNIRPNLLAFVRGSATGESQESSVGAIDQTWFEDKAFFFLRTQNFGFASAIESVAVVEAIPSAVPDRHLVIARRGDEVFARRLLRPLDSDYVSLASETPDPRNSRPTLQFHQREVALHKVVGMFFHAGALGGKGKDEAVQVDGTVLIEKIRSAFKVEEQSAIPLALEGQIALGGPRLAAGDYEPNIDRYAALSLSDGTTLFKRIGASLGGALSHVRQFEAIGGLGAADVLAVGKPEAGFKTVESAVLILGVLYHQ
jgi:hypothetical protein